MCIRDRKEPSRAELVRLRREQEHTKQMRRIVKDATRPVSQVVARKKAATTPKKKPAQNARRRFQIAMPAVSDTPRFKARPFNVPRPRVGWRLFSFILSALLGIALYLAFNLPQLRVTEAQVVGSQIVTTADVNSVLNIAGRPVFMLTPSDMETRLRLNY